MLEHTPIRTDLRKIVQPGLESMVRFERAQVYLLHLFKPSIVNWTMELWLKKTGLYTLFSFGFYDTDNKQGGMECIALHHFEISEYLHTSKMIYE